MQKTQILFLLMTSKNLTLGDEAQEEDYKKSCGR
jgi:hypothetical protein